MSRTHQSMPARSSPWTATPAPDNRFPAPLDSAATPLIRPSFSALGTGDPTGAVVQRNLFKQGKRVLTHLTSENPVLSAAKEGILSGWKRPAQEFSDRMNWHFHHNNLPRSKIADYHDHKLNVMHFMIKKALRGF